MIELLKEVPDYRQGNAIRHNLSDILMIGLLSEICNEILLPIWHCLVKLMKPS
jgi:hypothetical protein